MKICHMEAMKEIKALEEEKTIILDNERISNKISYKEGEDKVDTGYSYEQTRKRVAELDERVRKIRSALALANCTVILEGFDVTIGEGLVLLAQLGAEYQRLENMASERQVYRRITANGVLEYTECLYDVKKVTEEQKALRRRISALQVAIDRANLLNLIEV